MRISLHVPEAEQNKIDAVLELARSGYNHLASYTFDKKPRAQDLFRMLVDFYKEDSPSRKLAAYLALALRDREAIPGKPLAFKRLGAGLGAIALHASHAVIKDNHMNIHDVLSIPVEHEVLERYDIKQIYFRIGGGIFLEFADKKNKKATARFAKGETLSKLRSRRKKANA